MIGRWRAIVTAAVSCGAVALAGCGSGQPGASSHSPAVQRPSAPQSSGSPAPAVSLHSSEQVPFTGDAVRLTVQAAGGPASQRPIRLATATVALGDGTSATVSGSCAATAQPAPAAGLLVRHVYRQARVVSPQVTAATQCGRTGAAPSLAGASVSLRVLPAAPSASASWQPCAKNLLTVTATGTGAALGHVGELFTLRDTSSASCQLHGYPDLQLLAGDGRRLPTTVVKAVAGAYLFPAVTPHRVALRPGEEASFDLQYGDIPVGSAADEPYPLACPAATQAEVTLPNASGLIRVPATMAPCGGQVLVSPVVPGAQWLTP